MLTAVIVEDEPHAVRRLSMQLRQAPDVVIAGVARDGVEGLELIRRLGPDIAFLDISLPGMSGIELAQQLQDHTRPAVVFVTAYDAHAIEAFRLAAVDYLLKPVQREQVVEAVERVRARHGERTAGDASSGPREFAPEMWVSGRRGVVRLLMSAVDWFEAERDYIRIHAGETRYLIREPLHQLEARLDPKRFLRVHRSAIVNVDKVARIARSDNGRLSVCLNSGHVAPVGGAYADAVRALALGGRAPAPTRRRAG
jgi:DNA-binding LytR/AlgR family response regulator